jgi:hypothetical protein
LSKKSLQLVGEEAESENIENVISKAKLDENLA